MDQRTIALACWGTVFLDAVVALYLLDQGIFAFKAIADSLDGGPTPTTATLILLVHLIPASVMLLSAVFVWRRWRFRWVIQGMATLFMLLLALGHVLFAMNAGA